MAVKLMSHDDMLQRLIETNSPKLVSLEKWKLIVKWHEENSNISPDDSLIGGDSCAFCQTYYDRNSICTNACERCPIGSQDGGCDWGSLWWKYNDDPCLENAKAMVKMIGELDAR